jgi:putative aldouronate transport system substrate-binding protein
MKRVLASLVFGAALVAATVGNAQTPLRLSFFMLSANGETRVPDGIANPQKLGIDRALGVDLQLEPVPTLADYAAALTVRLGGDAVPDLFQIPNRQTLGALKDAGLLLDLTDAFDTDLRAVVELTGRNAVRQATIGGRVWGVASTQNLPQETYWIRQDWLERLGLPMPRTLSDLARVARAFVENDPDGDGRRDTYGLTGNGWRSLAPVFGAFGVGTPNTLYVEGGLVKSAFAEANFPRALEYARGLVNAGLVDPDAWTMKTGPEVRARLFNGAAGIAYVGWPQVARDAQLAELRGINPSARIAQVPTPIGPGGRGELPNEGGWPWRMWAVSARLKNDPARLKKVFEVLAYVSSPSGNRLVKYGLEGRQYTLVNGRVTATELLSAPDTGSYYLYQFTGRDEREYFAVRFPNQLPAIEGALRAPRKKDFANFVNLPAGVDRAAMDRFAEEETLRFVLGRRPLTQYAAFLGELRSAYNLDAFVAAGRAQLAAAGLLGP